MKSWDKIMVIAEYQAKTEYRMSNVKKVVDMKKMIEINF